MTDEELEAGIEAIQEMLAKREANAKVIEGHADSWRSPGLRRSGDSPASRRKAGRDMGKDMGTASAETD